MKISKNITSIFIVPSLEIPRQDRIDNGFINGYLSETITNQKFIDCVFLLFKPSFPSGFRKFVNKEYESEREILFDYDIENGFSILVYRLNPKFNDDFELIKQSRYSETSKEFQNKFPETIEIHDKKFNATKTEKSLQYRVFNKTQDLKNYFLQVDTIKWIKNPKAEYWYDFEMDNETLTTSALKEIVFEKFQQES